MPDGFFDRFITAVTGDTPETRREFRRYQQQGGGLSLNAWLRQGKPSPPTQITARTREILERTGGVPRGVIGGERAGAIGGLPSIQERVATQRAEREAADVPLTGRGLGIEIPQRPTEPPPSGFRWGFDLELNRWVPKFTGLTAQQRAQQELAQQELGQAEIEARRRQQQFLMGEERAGEQFAFQQEQEAARRALEQQQFGLQQQRFGQEEAFRQQQLQFQQSQQEQVQTQFQQQLQFQQEQARIAAEEQERQYRAQLAANPINWLQYSAYTGEQPVIQPWMIPLGFQNTGGTVAPQGLQVGQPVGAGAGGQIQPQLQAGQPIPGFQGQAGQGGIQTFAGLPQLTTPSAQLQARWGPTAQAQFLGYRRARTGAAPQETQFRLGSQRAPAGRFTGFGGFSRV